MAGGRLSQCCDFGHHFLVLSDLLVNEHCESDCFNKCKDNACDRGTWPLFKDWVLDLPFDDVECDVESWPTAAPVACQALEVSVVIAIVVSARASLIIVRELSDDTNDNSDDPSD